MQRADHDQWKSADVARLLALVESDRRYYQDLFAALPLAVAIVDAEWRITAINREFRRCFGPLDTRRDGPRLPDLIPDPTLEALLGQVLSTGQGVTNASVTIGAERPWRVSLVRIPGWQADGADELMLTFSEAEPAAEPDRATIEAAKRGAVERLSGRVAHVANNLLMIIGGYADELLESLSAGDARRGDVQEILNASRRMSNLARELTALARPTSFAATDFDLSAWATATAARLGITPGPIEPGLAARTAPALLDQLLAEATHYLHPHLGVGSALLLEASNHTHTGRVELRLRAEATELPAEVEERIFEPFSGEKVGPDPPLGLAGLVRPWLDLDGQIRFENSTLILTCPQGTAVARRILLVEDEPGIRALIVKTLERQHFQVLEYSSAEQALELNDAPDVLVTDLLLPGLSGRALDARLRQRWPALRTLFISGYTDDAELDGQIATQALPPGTAFLAKPFTAAQIADRLRELLDTPTFPAGA